jgi:DNA polymerase-3 subunit gamma/tau
LGRGGGGSLDVVEIDAASHNGVDDARDLRERAVYAPVRDQFKIFILDEAHMVTNQGFNALLKLVEEPPPHVKFVFATTEPEKVIGTIRSRTHHYPFRLVAPGTMVDYMEHLCGAESIQAEPGVLPLVVKAGGGSVRDSESVLDQLMAGSADGVLTYSGAVALLGFTPENLLEAMVDALATSDGGAALRVIESLVESGGDPRRFVEDFLERLRDLIVLAAAGDGALAALRSVPPDALAGMREHANTMGMEVLSRAADVVNAGLTQMTGATSPRLQVELLVPRMLVAAHGVRRPSPGAAPAGPMPAGPQASRSPVAIGPDTWTPDDGVRTQPVAVTQSRTLAEPGPPSEPGGPAEPAASTHHASPPQHGAPAGPAAPLRPAVPARGARTAAASAEIGLDAAAAAWSKVLSRLRGPIASIMRNTATGVQVDGSMWTFGFDGPGPLEFFRRPHSQERLTEAAAAVLGIQPQFTGALTRPAGGGAQPALSQRPPAPAPAGRRPPADSPAGQPPESAPPAPSPHPAPVEPPIGLDGDPYDPPPAPEPPPAPMWSDPAPPSPAQALQPRAASAPAPPATLASAPNLQPPGDDGPPDIDSPTPDDQDAEAAGLIGATLILQELGGEVISTTSNQD